MYIRYAYGYGLRWTFLPCVQFARISIHLPEVLVYCVTPSTVYVQVLTTVSVYFILNTEAKPRSSGQRCALD